MTQPVSEEVEDRQRARLAYCLQQWTRPEGGKIPQSEAGIAEHERLVDDYEIIYGPANPNSLKQYASVYANIRIGIQDQEENDAEVRAYNQRETQRKEKERADAKIRHQELMDGQQRAEAERVLSMNGQVIPLLQMQVDRLTEYTRRDAGREAELQGMLDSERYKDSPLLGSIKSMCEDVRVRLETYRGRLSKFQQDMVIAKAECDWARSVLGPEAPEEEAPEEETGGPKLRIPWVGVYRGTFRTMKAKDVPKEWSDAGVERVVIIWRGHTRQELRVFGKSGSSDIPLREVCGEGSTAHVLRREGKRNDYRISLEQYEAFEAFRV